MSLWLKPMIHVCLYLNTPLEIRWSGHNLGTFKESSAVSAIGKHWREKHFHTHVQRLCLRQLFASLLLWRPWFDLSPCEQCGWQSGTGTFFRSTSFFPARIIPPMLHTHLHLHVTLTRMTNGWSLGSFIKQHSFINWEALNTTKKKKNL